MDIGKESTVSYTDIMAALTSLPTVMQRYLAEGHMVKLEVIGTFYLSVQCSKTGIEKKELCSAELDSDLIVNEVSSWSRLAHYFELISAVFAATTRT